MSNGLWGHHPFKRFKQDVIVLTSSYNATCTDKCHASRSLYTETVLHSELQVVIGTFHCPLLFISPNHGKSSYLWEEYLFGKWEKIDVSSSCCLIFVSRPGSYRCSCFTKKKTEKVTFQVKSKHKNSLLH